MNINCSKCPSTMNEYKFTYNENNEDIGLIKNMEDNNTIKEISIDDVCENTKCEIMNMDCILYCTNCNFVCAFPHKYINNVFLTKCDNMIDYYDNFLENNIIHNFDINCKYCSNNLEKYHLETDIIEENDESFKILSMPNDFLNDIHIYDLNNNLIKTIKPHNYTEYKKLHELTTDISRNILCCNKCEFFIMNNLQEFYEPE